jgi:hypothetical protein
MVEAKRGGVVFGNKQNGVNILQSSIDIGISKRE